MPTRLDSRQTVNRSALPMVGSAANDSLDTILPKIDAELAKLFEDRNVLLTDGGLITFTGTTVQFTEDLKIELNSKIAGGAPTIINLGQATLDVSADGRMIYAVIDRLGGTATVTDDATSLPAVTSANQEVFLIAKRSDSGDGIQRLYFRNGTALDAGQTVRLGASGSGAGNANGYLESMKNTLVDATYNLLTPYIASIDQDTLLDGTSTAAYSLIDKTINFANIGDTLITDQLADANEFLNNDFALNQVDLSVFWRAANLDALATYEVSRNGGNEWQTITMERVGSTDLFHGTHVFTDESVNQTISTLTTVTSSFELNTTTQQRIAQPFVLTNKSLLKTVTLQLNKAGAPSGNFFLQILKDNGSGSPSTDADAVLVESAAIPLSSVGSGDQTVNVNIPDIYLASGTYHLSIRTDATYKASFVTSVTRLAWRGNAAGATPYIRIDDGTTWSTSTNNQVAYVISGISIDLRVRITSGTTDVKFEALGLFYEQEPGEVAVDNSNALLTDNHLGSTNPQYDRSVPGQGIFLRRPDGTLREIAIDNDDNIVVYST